MGKKNKVAFITNLYKDDTKLAIFNAGKDCGYGNTDYDVNGYTNSRSMNDSKNYTEANQHDILTKEEELLVNEALRLKDKHKKLKELWTRMNYKGYGIFLEYGGYIYEGIFSRNTISGYGLRISAKGVSQKGIFKNLQIVEDGEIYDQIEGHLALCLFTRGINRDIFMGETNILNKNNQLFSDKSAL